MYEWVSPSYMYLSLSYMYLTPSYMYLTPSYLYLPYFIIISFEKGNLSKVSSEPQNKLE